LPETKEFLSFPPRFQSAQSICVNSLANETVKFVIFTITSAKRQLEKPSFRCHFCAAGGDDKLFSIQKLNIHDKFPFRRASAQFNVNKKVPATHQINC
jgi:hypothetical protein